MGTDNLVFLELLEWFDPSGAELAHRLPEKGSGEIKWGAQLIVRDSQAAVFYSGGVACDALGPGRHTLTTKNIPILTKVLSLPWGFKSPFRAEVYFVNLKIFNGLRWGTRDPVAFRDTELGLVRLRAHGVLNVQVVQPVLFVNSLVGTQATYPVATLEEYLGDVVVSRLNDHLGENLDTLVNLPSRYEELADGLSKRLSADLAAYGLALQGLFINAITPPAEVQQAIDDRSRLGAVGQNLQELLQMKMAMALEKAAAGSGQAEAGIALGLGMMVPGLLAGVAQGVGAGGAKAGVPAACPECGLPVEAEARFCPHCGGQILALRRCGACGQPLPPQARFCSGCGAAAGVAPGPRPCTGCGAENRPESVFCNACGERLATSA
ncbi:MAG: SPFH domain-containing protein [Deltaproteobacteria bacterium]|nr:SPFH domain-containing protein [Deltaproteobacteria bacterium]